MTDTPPNPTGALVLCTQCKKFSTFTTDAVCSHCRNKGKKSGGRDEVAR